MKPNKKLTFVMAGVLAIAAVATPQIKELLKIGGAVAVVSAFGRDINKGINKLWNRKDSSSVKTKVVVILSVGSGGAAIGAAQVMGPPGLVDKVVAVAQPEANLMGIRLRALIPVSSKNVVDNIKIVDGVAVSGIVDMKL
jgi:hypothetical protein